MDDSSLVFPLEKTNRQTQSHVILVSVTSHYVSHERAHDTYLAAVRGDSNMASTLVFNCFIFSLIVALISADTPANCSYEDIEGNWIFSMSEGNHDRTLDCDKPGKTYVGLAIMNKPYLNAYKQ